MLKVGIVGLPNVGKSTLFNAVTRTRKAEAANYPFCTIEPNVGIVEVPDERLAILAKLVCTEKIVPAAIEFVDIAGLVKGACTGEGLGNQFLANIREVDAILQVVRCFDETDILHNMGTVDPVRDIEVVNTELLLADLQSVDQQVERWSKKAKSFDKEVLFTYQLLLKIQRHLNGGKPAYSMGLDAEEAEKIKQFCLLTCKPTLYVCNVSEDDLRYPEKNRYVSEIQRYLTQNSKSDYCALSAKLESELSELSPQESKEFLSALNLEDSGVSTLIRKAYRLLGLASYFTAGVQEVRAWTFLLGMTAPECAGIIHTDFQKGFIKAEVTAYDDFVKLGGYGRAKKEGKVRLEGKDYLFKEGDIALFKFNVTA
ncbi:MAG: redox-regulated ATPase YchF [Puniceicoccales bacterium]|jgi:GTP-binding protein YchF|nr:redox-regulated ATPase YchF [Puniceicoccales bacterium]